MNNEFMTTKEFWREFGIFMGIICFFFLSLFGMKFLTQKKWDEGLRNAIEIILEEKTDDKCVVGKKI